MKDIIIFDMDGTLIDSSEDITISVNFVRSNFGLPPLTKTEVVDIINGDRNRLAYGLYGIEEYTPQHRNLFESHYFDQCIKNTHLYEGILDLLEELKRFNFQLSVATNAYTKFAERMLSHLKIDQYFSNIVGACKVKKGKPDPDMIFYILNNSKPVRRVIMVGDNHTDLYAAKNANIEMVFANWGFGKIEDIHNVDFIAKNPMDILNYILD
ncbi:HAD family hydrolase [Calditerrivibrio sp.]|jgi:phosphoglycolate phosphatase|uniref:phosphoglycolate phosphatase n=1 Tax=Calditerrivibrio nitroreducens TaxID=477976 RepID=A0A2J6WRB6_9BACT|nr:MAG: HAD family hydrolase [Calditerrivibrio nitroreducens]